MRNVRVLEKQLDRLYVREADMPRSLRVQLSGRSGGRVPQRAGPQTAEYSYHESSFVRVLHAIIIFFNMYSVSLYNFPIVLSHGVDVPPLVIKRS